MRPDERELAPEIRPGATLQIDEDPAFEARTARVRRVGWALLGGALIAATTGAFGVHLPETIARAAALYVFLLFAFRLAGTRILGRITTFDFVLLLVISEATSQALVSTEASLTAAFAAIGTLIALDVALTLTKQHWRRLDRWLEGTPLVIVADGRPLRDRMAREQIDEADVLSAAREHHGLERMTQIRYAVLERSGAISVIPIADPKR